jgi:hypothetical protein
LYTIEGASNPVNNYVLMRDNLSNGTWTQVASVAGTQQVVNDPLYVIYQNTATWRVQTQWGITCTPTYKMDMNHANSNLNTSLSNKFTNLVTTEIKENFEDNSVSIFPNPTKGIFTLNTQNKNANIFVVDALGNILLNKLNVNATTSFDLSNYAKGLYLVKVICGEKVVIKKVVVE